MRRFLLIVTIVTLGESSMTSAFRVASKARRVMLNELLCKGTVAAGFSLFHPVEARADGTVTETTKATLPLESVYIGCGCFWHLQHSVAVFERDALGRGGGQLTCKTGYAGGKKKDKEDRVCYHNANNIADYGKLGHGEVVEVELPSDRVVDVARLYFAQFDPTTKGKFCRLFLIMTYFLLTFSSIISSKIASIRWILVQNTVA